MPLGEAQSIEFRRCALGHSQGTEMAHMADVCGADSEHSHSDSGNSSDPSQEERVRTRSAGRGEVIGADRGRTACLAALAAVVGVLLAASPESALAGADHVTWIKGYDAADTPRHLDRVGVLKIGPPKAPNVLVFNTGAFAGSAYIAPFARTLVKQTTGWQVWSVERRENQLEDQSFADQAKQGHATTQELFDYYLGWIRDPSISDHFQPIPDSQVEFAKEWGMKVAVRDLRKVVKAAQERGGHVVVMGFSLGALITTAYATWNFGGNPGAQGLSGLVYDDSGSSPTAVTEDEARQSLATLNEPTSSPWSAFVGTIPAPFAGMLPADGGIVSLIDPDGPSLGQSSGLLPAGFVPPVPVTNLAFFGNAYDTETSPEETIHAHVGRLAAGGDPRGWEQAGEITSRRCSPAGASRASTAPAGTSRRA
jgi:pimeloyl-ACP methyl ester carboxylesterase